MSGLLAVAAAVAEPLARDDFNVGQNVAFAIIAGIMLFCALKMVTTANVVHAALYLVIVLAGVAAIFLLLGSDFVGATQILVYLGAIVVLFLFGIMLTRAELGDDDTVKSERRTMGMAVGVLLLAVMSYALIDGFGRDELAFSDPNQVRYVSAPVAVEDLPTPVIEALDLGGASGEVTITDAQFASLEPEVQRRIPGAEVFGNTKEVADAVFSQYIVPFEAVSVLLLAALIGAVVVARKE